MRDASGNSPDPCERVGQIIAEYLAGVESGSPPDRAEILARYPDLAGHLRSFFAAYDQRRAGRASAASQSAGNDATLPLHPDADGNLSHEDSSGPSLPRQFGDYELLEELARGGMGVVFKARQRSLNRVVALKMILAGQLAGEEDVQRFYAEAEAAGRLDHPGIVPIHEVGRHEGQHFFSMGFVEGHSLAEEIADGPLPPHEAAGYVMKVALAVAYAHEQGVIHRDLKPANILLDANNEPRVSDFGLAKRLEGDSNLTATGQILGTPSYMPPEQAAGKLEEVGPLADVYSLGAVLYTLLTGRPPFQSANVMDTLVQVLEQEPVPPRHLNPDVPRDLDTIALKCLEKEPHHRYGSAGEIADELGRVLRDEPILARRLGLPARVWRWRRRNPLLAGLTAVAAACLVMVAMVSTIAYINTEQARRTAVSANERLQLALARQVTERVDSDLRQLVSQPRALALLLSQRRDWNERELAELMRGMVRDNSRIFGMCAAFEPFQFEPARRDYALYVYRSSARQLDHKLLEPPAYRLTANGNGIARRSARSRPCGASHTWTKAAATFPW